MTEGNLLHTCWHDPAWIPMLNSHNVMDYFSERTNPFYDRTCNNEVLKMQRVSPDQLPSMVGIEYCLLYVQEPILYVIRKQQRTSPSQVNPVADYYIIAGVVHQAPDLSSVLSSRILSAVVQLQSAFEEARSYAKYHPSRGYWWDFTRDGSPSSSSSNFSSKKSKEPADVKKPVKKRKKAKSNDQVKRDEPSSMFQRRRVDMLLDVWSRKFPPKVPAAVTQCPPPQPVPSSQVSQKTDDVKSEKDGGVNVKNEKPADIEQRGTKREAVASSNPKPEGKKQKLSS